VELRHHPDRYCAAWVGEGITHSFLVCFNYGVRVGTTAIKNMHSAETHPQPIDKYVQEELKAGHTIRLEEEEVATAVHVSRFAVKPKPHQRGNGD
jgi:hypothetical protein